MGEAETRELRARITATFASACRYDELWDYAADGEAVYSDSPWEVLKRINQPEEVVLFLPPREGGGFFLCFSMQALADVLENAARFEFAITDRSCSFLLAYSHSRFLMGRGNAVNWIS